jgi:cytochrome c oxidase assembly factor CtaG
MLACSKGQTVTAQVLIIYGRADINIQNQVRNLCECVLYYSTCIAWLGSVSCVYFSFA